jgi:hypothetical protein
LIGQGDVWIDSIQMADFTTVERVELAKMNYSASIALAEQNFSDCLRLLDSYWPQFLARHVPVDESTLNTSTPAPPLPEARTEPTRKPGVADRIRDLWDGIVR